MVKISYSYDTLSSQLNYLLSTLDVSIRTKLMSAGSINRYVINFNDGTPVYMDWRSASTYLSVGTGSIFSKLSDELNVKTTVKLIESPDSVKHVLLLARKMDLENKKWQKI